MTIFYDVFNGDADGLCALHQLRLDEPRASVLVTGVKRDIALLERVEAQTGDELTVLDVGLARNALALQRQLARGARCLYLDHHFPGPIPSHPNLKLFIDTAPDVCTALLVDRYLHGRHRVWAVVAAFGDNLIAPALRAAADLGLDEPELARMKELGECLNYNAYGDSVEDLNYPPADLYFTLSHYADPFDFMQGEPIFETLSVGRADDLFRASEVEPERSAPDYAIYILPDAPWSRRVSGSFGNHLAQLDPRRAHAVLTRRDGGYAVSVRAAVERPHGADVLCRQFEKGDGRKAAAGIDFLPEHEFERFVRQMGKAFG